MPFAFGVRFRRRSLCVGVVGVSCEVCESVGACICAFEGDDLAFVVDDGV